VNDKQGRGARRGGATKNEVEDKHKSKARRPRGIENPNFNST